jgi:hypothetical protein
MSAVIVLRATTLTAGRSLKLRCRRSHWVDPAYPVLARALRARGYHCLLENLRAPKANALDTTEREVA